LFHFAEWFISNQYGCSAREFQLEWNKVAEGGDSESLFALLNASLKT
jgi:hypothetical protein